VPAYSLHLWNLVRHACGLHQSVWSPATMVKPRVLSCLTKSSEHSVDVRSCIRRRLDLLEPIELLFAFQCEKGIQAKCNNRKNDTVQ